jgi:ornithine cyclodeaminase
MMQMFVDIVSERAVKKVASESLALKAVQEAFVAGYRKDGVLYPVVTGDDPDGAWRMTLKTGHVVSAGALGFKYGSYFTGNLARGVPNHGSTTVLVDVETGLPSAFINANYLNGLRTAAADAAAASALARSDSTTLGVVGSGFQIEFDIRALVQVRPISKIKIWSRTTSNAEQLKAKIADLGLDVHVMDCADVVRNSDMIVTATTSKVPIIWSRDVSEGTHISAMGTDHPGKQELEVALLQRARLFTDDIDQSLRIGEFQHLEGLDQPPSITHLGAVIAGEQPGRLSGTDITVFDSSGIALQDLVVAKAVLTEARKRGLTDRIEF